MANAFFIGLWFYNCLNSILNAVNGSVLKLNDILIFIYLIILLFILPFSNRGWFLVWDEFVKWLKNRITNL